MKGDGGTRAKDDREKSEEARREKTKEDGEEFFEKRTGGERNRKQIEKRNWKQIKKKKRKQADEIFKKEKGKGKKEMAKARNQAENTHWK